MGEREIPYDRFNDIVSGGVSLVRKVDRLARIFIAGVCVFHRHFGDCVASELRTRNCSTAHPRRSQQFLVIRRPRVQLATYAAMRKLDFLNARSFASHKYGRYRHSVWKVRNLLLGFKRSERYTSRDTRLYLLMFYSLHV